MPTGEPKPMTKDSKQSVDLDAIRARFRQRSQTMVDDSLNQVMASRAARSGVDTDAQEPSHVRGTPPTTDENDPKVLEMMAILSGKPVTSDTQAPAQKDTTPPAGAPASTPDAAIQVTTNPDVAGKSASAQIDAQIAKRAGRRRAGKNPPASAPLSTPAPSASVTTVTPPPAMVAPTPEPTAPATPEPVVLATPDDGDANREDYALAEGQVWEVPIEVQGLQGTEEILIQSISGNDVQVRKRRKFLGGQPFDSTYSSAVDIISSALRDGKYKMVGKETSDRMAGQIELPKEGEVFHYRNTTGEVMAVRCVGLQQYEEFNPKTDSTIRPLSEADLRGWQQVDSVPVTPTEQGGDVLRGRDPKNYEELFEGDVWVLLGPDGKEERRVMLNMFLFLDYNLKPLGKVANVYDSTWEEEKEGDETKDQFRSSGYNDIELEKLRQELRDKGFVLSKAGRGRSEKPREGAPTPEPVPTPEAKPLAPERMGPPTLDEALAEARAAVDQTRADFVRLETEQIKGWQYAKKILGNFFGKDTSEPPEVSDARVKYQAALAQLLNLQVDDIKRQNLSGKELHKAIAWVTREYEFEEGERLDDGRRELRMGEAAVPLKEKWKKVLEDAKRSENIYTLSDGYSEVTGQKEWYNKWALLWGGAKFTGTALARGTKAVGETYNKITKTRTGKITTIAVGAAGAATLAFASGGAALGFAGFVMAGKRAVAGAGVALVAEEGMAVAARGMRSRRAMRQAEEVIVELEKREQLGTEAGWDELLHNLSSRTIAGLADRDLARKKWALRRKAIAMFGGTLMGTGAAAQLIGIGVQEAREAVGGSGAVGRVAERLPGVASTPSAAASAAEAAASAPSGAASAADAAGRVGAVGGPATGALAPSELPNALNQDTIRYPSTTQLSNILSEKTIVRGDTVWKYGVEAAKTAGLDEAGQKRFSGALTQALREKLSMVSPEEAAKYGFYPNKAGLLTPDYIRAGKTLDIAGLLGQEKLAALVEQAQTPSGGTAAQQVIENSASSAAEERAVGVPRTDIEADVKNSLVGKDILYAPGDRVEPEPIKASVIPDQIDKFIQDNGFNDYSRLDVAMNEYMRGQPQEAQLSVIRNIREGIQHIFNVSGAPSLSEHPELAKVSVARILADHKKAAAIVFVDGTPSYDATLNPLDEDQMVQVAKLHAKAAKVLGEDIAQPIKAGGGESVAEYVRRLTIFAHMKGVSVKTWI